MNAENPNPDPGKTLLRLVAVLVMLAVAVTGLVYTAHLLWTLPAKP